MEEHCVPQRGIVPVPEPFMSPREVRRHYNRVRPHADPQRERGRAAPLVVFESPDGVPRQENSPANNPRVAYPVNYERDQVIETMRRSVEASTKLPETLYGDVNVELNVRSAMRPHTNKFYGTIKCMLDVVNKMDDIGRAAVSRASFADMGNVWQYYPSELGPTLAVGVQVREEDWAVVLEMRMGCIAVGNHTDVLVRNLSLEDMKDAFSYSMLQGNLGGCSISPAVCQSSTAAAGPHNVGTSMYIDDHGDSRMFAIDTFSACERAQSVWPLDIGQAVIVALVRIREQWDRIAAPAVQ